MTLQLKRSTGISHGFFAPALWHLSIPPNKDVVLFRVPQRGMECKGVFANANERAQTQTSADFRRSEKGPKTRANASKRRQREQTPILRFTPPFTHPPLRQPNARCEKKEHRACRQAKLLTWSCPLPLSPALATDQLTRNLFENLGQ